MELTTSVPAAPYLATVSLPGVGKADGTLVRNSLSSCGGKLRFLWIEIDVVTEPFELSDEATGVGGV